MSRIMASQERERAVIVSPGSGAVEENK